MKQAELGAVRIYWIPIQASSYQETALGKYQALHNPAEPLARMSKAKRNQAWVEICKRVQKEVGQAQDQLSQAELGNGRIDQKIKASTVEAAKRRRKEIRSTVAKRGVGSFSMIDTDSALYGRRLVRQIQKHSHDGVFVDTPIGRYRVYYAEFVGDNIQIRTACKRAFLLQPNEWPMSLAIDGVKKSALIAIYRKGNTDEQS